MDLDRLQANLWLSRLGGTAVGRCAPVMVAGGTKWVLLHRGEPARPECCAQHPQVELSFWKAGGKMVFKKAERDADVPATATAKELHHHVLHKQHHEGEVVPNICLGKGTKHLPAAQEAAHDQLPKTPLTRRKEENTAYNSSL